MRPLYLVCLALASAPAFAQAPKAAVLVAAPLTTVLQAGKPVAPELRQGRSIRYRVKPPFVLRVRGDGGGPPTVAIQVCASAHPRIFEQIKPGGWVAAVPCYRPGTGMATSARGEDPRQMRLFLSDGEGHNYYHTDRRVDRAGYSDIHVTGVTGTTGEPVTSGTIYAIVFVDHNRNGVVDESEYELLEITLQP